MDEIFEQMASQPKRSVWDNYVPIVHEGRHTDIYFHDLIDVPSNYSETCHLLAKSYKGDTVKMHINNGGGYVDSAFMLRDAMEHSNAKITGKLAGTVASSATILTMACDNIEVADYVQFMIHNYSGGAQGKGHEMKAQMDFTDAQLNMAFKNIYGGFLTEYEMELVIAGKDIWMGKEELLGRWKARKTGDLELLEEWANTRKGK